MMSESRSESYKAAGVDVVAGYESVKLMKPMVESTFIPGVMGSLGGFGGMFAPNIKGMEEPILVSGTDGVGTKLKLAFLMDKHDTIGIDAVAMCVNDIACCGAQPLFFLDYIAVGKNFPAKIAAIVSGVAEGCRQAGCALIGGETAEMPGFYPEDEYDVAGFSVGMVDKPKMIDGSRLEAGDVLIGVASSGVHSNGYSLVRKTLGINEKSVHRYMDEFGKTLGEELLTPTRIYVKAIQSMMQAADVKAISHITGGGFYENIPRMLKDGIHAEIEKAAAPVPAVFDVIAKTGNIPERDMYNTFNMGVGLVTAVAKNDADKALAALAEAGEKAYIIGQTVAGEKGITLK
jgi:phosphoribosylformylglycinamidine cyclo-ligase